jgi:SP family sugar:H+ symporter-like MFS transporter
MPDFRERFAENAKFDATRAGTIVGLLAIGTLIGCLMSGWICDKLGRRKTISASAFFYICGVVIEVTSNQAWGQFAAGRFVAGLGIGALSTAVPMYQSESVPKTIRGVVVSSYQLMITIGLLAAFIVSISIQCSLDV